MKRFVVFTLLFPPLALLVYTSPLFIHDGIPKPDFIVFLMTLAYVIATVPGWVTAGVDWMLAAKPFHIRVIATMAAAMVMAQLVALYLGNPMYVSEIVTVALTGAIPAALCSWLSGYQFAQTA